MKQNLFRENREQLVVLTTLITILASGKSTNGEYVIWEENVPPLAGPPPHSHPDEEVFHVLSGNFEFVLDDVHNLVQAKKGDVIKVPANALHTYKNTGDAAGRLLTILTPGKLEDYFREVGKPVTSAQDIPNVNEVPNFAALDVTNFMAFAPKHDVTFYLTEMIH